MFGCKLSSPPLRGKPHPALDGGAPAQHVLALTAQRIAGLVEDLAGAWPALPPAVRRWCKTEDIAGLNRRVWDAADPRFRCRAAEEPNASDRAAPSDTPLVLLLAYGQLAECVLFLRRLAAFNRNRLAFRMTHCRFQGHTGYWGHTKAGGC